MRGVWILLLGSALLGSSLPALERSSPDSAVASPVDQRPAALRPLVVFNMRGRRDPFATSFLWKPKGQGAVSISGLELKGIIQVGSQVTALFIATADRSTFTMRGNHLFGSDDKPVQGVVGRFIGDKEVRLQQGELALNFSALRATKRKI